MKPNLQTLSSWKWLFLLLLLTACGTGPKEMALQPAEGPVRIVVLGSSTAEGTGPTDPANAWVNRYRDYVLEARPGSEVVNLAKGGYTTYHILPTGSDLREGRPAADTARNITRALELKPDAILINLPSNDAASGFTVAEQLENYATVAAAAGDVPLWIMTPQPRNLPEKGRSEQEVLRNEIRARYGDHVIDFWSGIAAEDRTVKPDYDSGDGIHLNDEAHRLLFERVQAAHVLGVGAPVEALAE